MQIAHKKIMSTIENIFLKSGKIVAVHSWNGGNIHEMDVHLPDVHFENRDRAQSIKCRISVSHYSNYN